jgi:hypothetical protein
VTRANLLTRFSRHLRSTLRLRRSRGTVRVCLKPISLAVPFLFCWTRSIVIVARASRRSRLSTFTSTKAARPSSAMSGPRGVGIERNQRINPMQGKLSMHLSRRCRARTRRGSLCQSPAMPNGRCRMHGGPSPGAPKGNRNALKHGRYTADAIARRREIGALLRAVRTLITEET